jgi:hypothetical protein
MQYRFLNWFSKQALILLGALCCAPLHAETCPTQAELQLQPDGYFVTDNGWRSEGSYKGLKDPLPIFRQVTLTQQLDDEIKISGCQYDIQGARVLPLLMLPPASSTVAPPTGKNWREVSKSHTVTEYQCVAWRSKKPCEFTFTFLVGAATGGLAGNPFGMK